MAVDRNMEDLVNPLYFGDKPNLNYAEIGIDGSIRMFGTANMAITETMRFDAVRSGLAVDASAYSMRMPRALTLTGIRASVGTAPAGSSLIVDVLAGGTSILSTPLSIDAEATASGSASLAGTDGEVSSVSVDGVIVTSAAVPYNTVNDVAASGTITLSGTDGNILSVLVGGVETIVTAVPFNTDLTTTAADLVTEINLNTTDYAATSALEVVTITGVTITGAGANGTTVVSTTDLTMVGTDVDLAGGVSDIAPTATDLAANITAAVTVPNYTAASALGVVTITPDLAGDSVNGFVVLSTTTLTMVGTDTDLAGGVTEKTSTTSSSQAVISNSALIDDQEITVSVTQVGSSIAGSDLGITLIGTRNVR